MRRSAGVLLHITSLPGVYGIGGFGKEAEAFARKLKEAGIVGFAVTNGTMRDTVENADLDTMRFRTMYFAHGKMPAFAIRVIDANMGNPLYNFAHWTIIFKQEDA